MAAFRAAIAADVGIECDLRLTSDHKIVVFHDSDAWRLCGYSLLIGDTLCDEVQRLSVGGDPIPRLEELLALVDGQVPLLLEVKVEADVRHWVPVLKKALANYRGKHGVMSFDPRISRLLKLAHPRVRRGLVIRDELAPVRRRVALMLADPHFIAIERTAVGNSWVQAIRERLPVYSWTIRGPQQRGQAQVHADALIWEADGRP